MPLKCRLSTPEIPPKMPHKYPVNDPMPPGSGNRPRGTFAGCDLLIEVLLRKNLWRRSYSIIHIPSTHRTVPCAKVIYAPVYFNPKHFNLVSSTVLFIYLLISPSPIATKLLTHWISSKCLFLIPRVMPVVRVKADSYLVHIDDILAYFPSYKAVKS